jgi:hypothetical protein
MLTTKDLTLGGATYAPELNAANSADQIKVVGAVNLTGSTLAPTLNFTPATGSKFTIIDNDGADAVVGTFNGQAQGMTVHIGGRPFSISYTGGNGNDVVLTAIGGLPRDFAVGPDSGGAPSVKVFNPDGSPKITVSAFEPSFTGGVRTASADVNGDGIADLIVGCGPGRVAEVRVFDGTNGSLIRSIQPFADFTGGTFVAAGDFDNDGKADVIVTPDLSGGPRVSIFSGADGSAMANFFGIDDANFRGGARAAAGDVNGDGTTDLVLSAGFGGGPRIAVFDGKSVGGTPTKLMNDFFAFEQALRNGCYVTVGDIDGDGKADMIFGGGPGGGPRVYASSGADGSQLANFFAGNVDNRGGVRVATKDLDNDVRADVVVGDGSGAGSHVSTYLGKNVAANGTPPVKDSFDAFAGFLGGVFVG